MNRAVTLAFCLLVAACTEEPPAPAERGGKAAGEVLGGEISDAMIPLEQLDSQAPLAPRQGLAPRGLDAEQPLVTQVEGLEDTASGEGAEAAPAAPPLADPTE